MEAINDCGEISIKLSRNEALVLFEWLAKFNEQEHPMLFEDSSEEIILFNLEALLDKNIFEIFNKNYLEKLSRARQEVKDKSF